MSRPKLDLRGVVRPAAAIKLLKAYLLEHHGAQECDLTVFDPKQEAEWAGSGRKGCWRLIWEGGPYEWGVRVSMGCSMYECNGHGAEAAEILCLGNKHWFLEPYYSFDVGFVED